ncbi:MAG: hypothetical protein R2706_14540 [Acidimicrobiales bacterium]
MLPLDDRGMELFTLRRPGSELNRNELLFRLGTDRRWTASMPDIRNRSWCIRAEFDLVDEKLPNGVMVAGGVQVVTFYLDDGAVTFACNRAGRVTSLSARMPSASGRRSGFRSLHEVC